MNIEKFFVKIEESYDGGECTPGYVSLGESEVIAKEGFEKKLLGFGYPIKRSQRWDTKYVFTLFSISEWQFGADSEKFGQEPVLAQKILFKDANDQSFVDWLHIDNHTSKHPLDKTIWHVSLPKELRSKLEKIADSRVIESASCTGWAHEEQFLPLGTFGDIQIMYSRYGYIVKKGKWDKWMVDAVRVWAGKTDKHGLNRRLLKALVC